MRLSGCCCRLHRISTLNSLTARMSHILHALSLTLWHNHMKPVSCSFFFALPFRFYFNLDSHCWRRAASACTVDRCLSLTYVRRRPLASSQASAQAVEENKKFSFILWVFANLVCISYLYEIHSRQIPQHGKERNVRMRRGQGSGWQILHSFNNIFFAFFSRFFSRWNLMRII